MAQARWEMAAAVAAAAHNNGMNTPIRDANTLNPYGPNPLVSTAAGGRVRMTLAEVLPLLQRHWG
jgi:hypothetical protein